MPRETEDFDFQQTRKELNKLAKLASKGRSETTDLRHAADEERAEAEALIAKADEVQKRR
jgi:hypothetical protein